MKLRPVGAVLFGLGLLLPAGARAQSIPVDSTSATVSPALDFDRISRSIYLRRHAFSLDNFLEFEPGGLVARRGPIGNDAFYSRWGIGRGRALVTINHIPVNNPQDATAPFAHIATSGLSTVDLGAAVHSGPLARMEGSLAIRDLAVPRSRPATFVELSKGTNELRQRRVRFGSEAGRVGLDLTYDEVLDDGYNFVDNDALFGTGPEGRARTRNGAIVVRGDVGDESHYAIGIRRHRSSTTGDLISPLSEASQSGHIAWAGVASGPVEATVYGRGYKNENPDSTTNNETVGGVVHWNAKAGDASLHAFALGEHTNATQDVNTAVARNRVSLVNAGLGADIPAGPLTWFLQGDVAGDEKSGTWGAGAGVRAGVGPGDVTLAARRLYRLPSIGERYLPRHGADSFILLGNEGLDAETTWEGSAEWRLRAGAFTNRVRAVWMRSDDYIAFTPVAGDSLARRAANGTGTPSMTFIEERVGVEGMLGFVEVRTDAGAYFSTGDREGAFMSVPQTQVNAVLMFGVQLFEKSSQLQVGGEYAFVDTRRDYNGVQLPSSSVVNLALVARLIDAHFYLKWLNVLDENYQTISGYQMTPRTLAYGIEWTLFD